MSSWTFITNHGAVLGVMAEERTITAKEIAARLGITERSVRRIVVDLESEGYVEKDSDGTVNSYHVNAHLPLRRPDQRDTRVAGLLKLLLPEGGGEHAARPAKGDRG